MSEGSKRNVEVILTVSQDHAGRLDEVAERMKAQGLAISYKLANAGLICGFIDKDKVAALSDDIAVLAVERSGSVDIGPPDSDVQ